MSITSRPSNFFRLLWNSFRPLKADTGFVGTLSGRVARGSSQVGISHDQDPTVVSLVCYTVS